ncbi:hypothetical protein [Streptomyces sp. LUP30]|uniref:hypothetical protein n=1 Tax=Streptomyces sp. LUP30 TaxID=1890285 RepID=UPI0008519964|nr:hypothetical protein [Streptomyces sp. LUP30]
MPEEVVQAWRAHARATVAGGIEALGIPLDAGSPARTVTGRTLLLAAHSEQATAEQLSVDGFEVAAPEVTDISDRKVHHAHVR